MVKDIGRKSGKMNKGRKIVRKPTKKRPGFHVNGDGYKLIRMNGRYVFEHRLVMEKYIGRLLEQHERVHHKNHDRLDNRIENLELVANHSEHIKKHHNKRNKDGTFR